MSRFFIPNRLDPAAEATRQQMRRLGNPRDVASGTLRLALHLSEAEANALERLNPDTLGHSDGDLRKRYWRQFCEAPESAPFRVNEAVR